MPDSIREYNTHICSIVILTFWPSLRNDVIDVINDMHEVSCDVSNSIKIRQLCVVYITNECVYLTVIVVAYF